VRVFTDRDDDILFLSLESIDWAPNEYIDTRAVEIRSVAIVPCALCLLLQPSRNRNRRRRSSKTLWGLGSKAVSSFRHCPRSCGLIV